MVIEAMVEADLGGKRVLDFGCGASAILSLVASELGADVVACEIHPAYAAEAKRQIAANELDIPVVATASGSFDFAVANVGDAHLVGEVSKLATHGVGTDSEGELIRW